MIVPSGPAAATQAATASSAAAAGNVSSHAMTTPAHGGEPATRPGTEDRASGNLGGQREAEVRRGKDLPVAPRRCPAPLRAAPRTSG
jgi:hypothetical protein